MAVPGRATHKCEIGRSPGWYLPWHSGIIDWPAAILSRAGPGAVATGLCMHTCGATMKHEHDMKCGDWLMTSKGLRRPSTRHYV